MEPQAFVQFETRSKEDRKATIKEGHYVAIDVDYAIITPPGGNLVVEREVDDEIMARYREGYDAWKKGQEVPVEGTHLKNWPVASPAQIDMCLRTNVRTVEELATLSESGVQRIGMGGITLRQKAQAWLDAANGTGKGAAEIEKLTVIVSQQALEIKELRGLLQQQGYNKDKESTATRKKPGPKPRSK